MTYEKSRKITSDIEILRDIADLIERCKKEAKTYKIDIPWPDPLDHSEIKDSKEKCDQKFKDGIRYFQG